MDRRDRLAAAALLVLGASIWTAGFTTGAFANPDAFDYAQMGRELARGHGFSTLQLFPRHLPTLQALDRLSTDAWPNLHRYPLPSIPTAAMLSWTADPVVAAVAQCGLWYVLAIPLVFVLARRVLPLGPAVLAALLHAGTPNVVKSGYDGMTESLALVLVVLVLLVALYSDPRPRNWMLLGAACGLGLLARSPLVILLPLALGAAALRSAAGTRLRSAVVVLVGLLAVLGPWAARNAALTGSPAFSFSNTRNLVLDTGAGPGDLDMALHAAVRMGDVVREYGPAIGRKLLRNLALPFVSLRFWTENLASVLPLALLALVGAFARRIRSTPAYRTLGPAALALFPGNLVVCALAFHTDRFYVPLYPIVVILAVAAAWSWVEGIAAERPGLRAVAGLTVAALAFSQWGYAWREYGSRTRLLPEGEALYAALRSETSPDHVVASDVSFRTALLAERRSIRLPSVPDEILEIDARWVRLDHVVVTGPVLAGTSRGDGRFGNYGAYAAFVRSPAFLARYVVVAIYADGTTWYRRREVIADGP